MYKVEDEMDAQTDNIIMGQFEMTTSSPPKSVKHKDLCLSPLQPILFFNITFSVSPYTCALLPDNISSGS